MIAQLHPNITLIGSAIHEMAILHAIQMLGAGRICFGSDSPFRLMHVQLAMYQALLRDHSSEDQEKVLGGNIARILQVNESAAGFRHSAFQAADDKPHQQPT